MTQRRIVSIIEVTANLATGAVISMFVTYYALPLWGYSPSLGAAGEIVALYTVVSWLRSMAFRRLFNHFTSRAL
jgi:hypothetical protein